MATHSFSPHSIDLYMLAIFSFQNIKQGHIFVCLLDQPNEAQLANIKMERQRWPEMPLIWGSSGTQYVVMVIKLLSSYCGAHLVESHCEESNISDSY